MRKLALLLSLLLLSAYASTATTPTRDLTDADCARQGGTLKRIGRAQRLSCVVPYPDAGKPCRDGSDCQGGCLTTKDVRIGDQTVGACAPDNNPFGCRQIIENGVVADAICVD